jgi:flagellar hook assembly protein FlgD
VAGRLVTTLVNEERSSGTQEVTWQGRDSNGEQVATGVYFYRLDAGEFSETKRMALVK